MISMFWTVKLLYSYMRQLYQNIDYINWLAASYTNKQLFSICYNIIIPYVQNYHALTLLWEDNDGATASVVTWHSPYGLEQTICANKISIICLFGSPALCLVPQLFEQLLEKQILKIILDILW